MGILLANNAQIDTAQRNFALLSAIEQGNRQIVRELLGNKEMIDTEELGYALHYAVEKGRSSSIVEELLANDRYITPQCINQAKQTAQKMGKIDIISVLENGCKKWSESNDSQKKKKSLCQIF